MIILVEVTDIINAVEKHGHPFDAQTEGEAGPPVRVQFDQLEHLWIDHPTPHDFNPPVTEFSEVETFEVDFETGLGKWEETGSQSSFELISE